MNDIRRSILWVIFGFSLVLIWDKWQIHNGNAPTFFPSSAVTAPKATDAAPPAASASLPAALPGAAAPTITGTPPEGASSVAQVRHTVTTDVFRLTFNSEGGSLIGAQLLKHAQDVGGRKNQEQPPFTLLEDDGERVYIAQTGLIGGRFPNHKTPMTLVSGGSTLADGQNEMQLRFESADIGGVKLVKTYTLQRGSYVIGVQHEVVNNSGQAVSPQLYLQLVRDDNQTANSTPFYSTFTGPAVFTEEKKYQKVAFADIEKGKAEFVQTASDGYVAMVQHYFTTAWLMADGVARDNFARKTDGKLFAVGAITALSAIEPGQSERFDARLFVGPQDEKVLETVAPGLPLVKDYGWLTILAKPLYWLLEKIHGFVANWGWSIVLLVVLIKAAFYWLNATAFILAMLL